MNRSKITVLLSVAVAVALATAACASIMHGTGQALSITSAPAGATVSVDDQVVGVTPVSTKLSRNDPHIINVKLDGYQPFQLRTTRHMDGWLLGNIVFGGPLGLVIDVVDGAAYKLKPSDIAAQLARTNANARVEQGTLYVFLSRDADSSWQKIGQLQHER